MWHNGGTYGFSSFGGFVKEKDCALVLLSNTGSNTGMRSRLPYLSTRRTKFFSRNEQYFNKQIINIISR